MDERDRENYARYCALCEQREAGRELTGAERAFCERMQAEHPVCARERVVLAELADMEGAPGDAARDLVTATMEALASDDEDDLALDTGRSGHRRMPGRPLLWVVATLGVAAAAALALVANPQQASTTVARKTAHGPVGPPRVELVYASGDARVDDAAWTGERQKNGLLREGQRLDVGAGGACLVLDPDINVCLDADSSLTLTELDSTHRKLSLHTGKVALSLLPQPRGSSVTIEAGGVESTALGTVFSVALDAGGSVQTTVLEGKVRVDREGEAATISAHERHEVSGEARGTRPLSRRDEAPEWAAIQATRLWRDRLSGTLTVHGAPAGASVLLDGEHIGVAPLVSLVPAGVHEVVVRGGDRLLARRVVDLEVGKRRVVRYDRAEQPVAQRPAATSEPPGTAHDGRPVPTPGRAAVRRKAPRAAARRPAQASGLPSAGDMLREARRLMLAGNFERAAQTYDAVRRAHPRSPEARTALVPLAELQLDRLGRPQRALELVDSYLKRGGTLAHEARCTRVRALRRLGYRLAERQAIEGLLSRHPGSFRAAQLRARLSELEGR